MSCNHRERGLTPSHKEKKHREVGEREREDGGVKKKETGGGRDITCPVS